MKQIIEYIRSYSKALLRKIGVQVRSNLVMKPYGGVEGLFEPNVGCRQNFGTTHSEAI